MRSCGKKSGTKRSRSSKKKVGRGEKTLKYDERHAHSGVERRQGSGFNQTERFRRQKQMGIKRGDRWPRIFRPRGERSERERENNLSSGAGQIKSFERSAITFFSAEIEQISAQG